MNMASTSVYKSNYFEDDYTCSFCGAPYCFFELNARVMYRELDAFVPYRNYDQKYLIDNAVLTIDYNLKNVRYSLGDTILCDYSFSGEKIYYFDSPPNVAEYWARGNWVSEPEGRIREVLIVINNFITRQTTEKLKNHGIIIAE